MKHILTRKKAIRKHRKMWRWIYKAIEKDMFPQFETIAQYKREYIKDYEQYRSAYNYCYLCEYTHNKCLYCPLQWELLDGTRCMFCCMNENSLYNYLGQNFRTMPKQLKLDCCRRIANLKEKEQIE